MSVRSEGGTRLALLKRHYDADDFVRIPLVPGMAETYYTIGMMAYLSDPAVAVREYGWTTFTHGQPAVPAWLAPILAAAGVTWPAIVPGFEAKDILFHPDVDCWVRFRGPTRVQHFIPANAWLRFHPRTFILFVAIDPAAGPGTLNIWIEG